METRELYKQKYAAQLHEWTAKFEVLKAQGEKKTAQAKLDAKPRLDGMSQKLEQAKTKMHELASATDDKWEEVKTAAEHAWNEAKAAVEGAVDAVTETAEASKKVVAEKPAPAQGS